MATRSTTRALIATTAAALLVAGCGSSGKSTAADTPAAPAVTGSPSQAAGSSGGAASTEQVCAAGQKEGRFDFASSTDVAVFQEEVKPFEEKYPGIKVNFSTTTPAANVQRLLTQEQANKGLGVDALTIDLPTVDPLLKRGFVTTTDWRSLGIPQDLVLTLDGATMFRSQRVVLGLGYNTTKLSAADLPNTWQELINSKWAGKVIVDPRGIYLSGLGLVWGKDQAISWFKDFMKVDKPMVVRGATASLEKVISGEALLTTSSHDAEVREQQAKGAPVDIKYLDVVTTQDNFSMVLKGAAHPNAATCFMAWWGSPEGQAQQLKYEYKSNDTTPKGLPSTTKLGAVTDASQAAPQTEIATEFAKIVAGG
jgi:iron(III) transport system substrate-binding protein